MVSSVDAESVPWVQSQHPAALVHLSQDVEEPGLAYCRKRPLVWGYRDGTGLASTRQLVRDEWCPSCFFALPVSLRRQIISTAQ